VLEVLEYTDPACPWAWGSEPTLRRLRELLGLPVAGAEGSTVDGAEGSTVDGTVPVRWRRVFGILFDEDDDAPPDPAAETAWYRGQLAQIGAHTGAPLPVALRWVTRTSWPASLAATAARSQGGPVAERVLRRLRESTFVLGTPADSRQRVLAVLRGVAGLDRELLAAGMRSAQVRAAVRRDWTDARTPCPEVFRVRNRGPHPGAAKPTDSGHRYALPTLVLCGPAGRAVVPGWRSLRAYLDAVRRVAPGALHRPGAARTIGAARPAEALARYRSLTGPELRVLAGADRPPAGAVRVPTRNAPFWLDPGEAVGYPLYRDVKDIT
jgi:DSBA-like thioredoxin domain